MAVTVAIDGAVEVQPNVVFTTFPTASLAIAVYWSVAPFAIVSTFGVTVTV